MNPVVYNPVPLDAPDPDAPESAPDWVWDGLVARGDVALLTSFWKAGKTTLLAGLFHALDAGLPFLGRATAGGNVVVVSEESRVVWDERRRAIPVGGRVRFALRPFRGSPTAAEWDDFIAQAEAARAAAPIDLFVVDTLACFLPGRSESDRGAVLDFLDPLRRLADGGTAVIVLHHPRKERAEEGSGARGSGVLLGSVDTAMELTRHGRLPCDENRRRVVVRSRHPGAPAALLYEWVRHTPTFVVLGDVGVARYEENWESLRQLLADRTAPVTHRELLAVWPADRPAPTARQLYDWLNRAVAAKRVERFGTGSRRHPFGFALPRKPLDPRNLPPLPRL